MRGAGAAALVVRADGAESNRATLTLTQRRRRPRAPRVSKSVRLRPRYPSAARCDSRRAPSTRSAKRFRTLSVAFETEDAGVAAVDASGLARGVAQGVTAVRASVGETTSVATLRVVERTLVINEVLADPPDGAAGDANHDGVRVGAEEEFVELVNGSTDALDLSGWTLRTRTLSGTAESVRHTFTKESLLPGGRGARALRRRKPRPARPRLRRRARLEGERGVALAHQRGAYARRARRRRATSSRSSPTAPRATTSAATRSTNPSRARPTSRAPTRATPTRTARAGSRPEGALTAASSSNARAVSRALRSRRFNRLSSSASRPTFTARAFDQYERVLRGVRFDFKSSDAGVAERGGHRRRGTGRLRHFRPARSESGLV